MTARPLHIPGDLIAIPCGGPGRTLDGFLSHGPRPNENLLIIVHGMGSNFHRSTLKKTLLATGPDAGWDVFSFNNRGADRGTMDERFTDSLTDIESALALAKARGYRRVVLAGHSTGCQKIAYHQSLRANPLVAALTLLAPADDLAICRRDLGRRFAGAIARARRAVASGKPTTLIPGLYEPMTARRFLSLAVPTHTEASLFDYAGSLKHFRRVRIPVLALFGAKEEFAVLPVQTMLGRLRDATRSSRFEAMIIPNADHGFHGSEKLTTRKIFAWLATLPGV